MKVHVFVAVLFVVAITGCAQDPKSGKGFTLPDGDAERGQQTFAQLQCNACHTVKGVEFESLPTAETKMIALGGDTASVVTYGDLVTSIINPSHRFAYGNKDEAEADGQSRMRVYNDEMTVTQLMDLVAFLQSHYKVKEYQPTPYMPYY